MAVGSVRNVVALSTNWSDYYTTPDEPVLGVEILEAGRFVDSSIPNPSSSMYVGDYISFSNDATHSMYKVTEVYDEADSGYDGLNAWFDGEYTPTLGDVITIYDNTDILLKVFGSLNRTPDVVDVYLMEGNSIECVDLTVGYSTPNTDIPAQSDVHFIVYGRTSKDGVNWADLGQIARLSDITESWYSRDHVITTLIDSVDLSEIIPTGSKYLQIRAMVCVGDEFTAGYNGESLYNRDGVSEVSEWSASIELPQDNSNVRIFADILNEGNCTWLTGKLVVFNRTDETTGSWIAGIGKINQ